MTRCPECESENIENTDMGLICLCCGFEMGEAPDEKIYEITNVPIDKRFNSFLDHFFGSVGDKNRSANEIVEQLKPYFNNTMTCKDLMKVMRDLDLKQYYESCSAIYSILKTGKVMTITPQQREALISDYKQFVIKFKEIIKERHNLPKQSQILASLLIKNKIRYDPDLIIDMLKSRKENYKKDFQKVFDALKW